MAAMPQPIDAETREFEREAFALLQRVYTAAEGRTEARLLASRIADAAGLDRARALRLMEHLEKAALLLLDPAGPVVGLTLPGKAYVEQLAWRRQSVRQRWTG